MPLIVLAGQPCSGKSTIAQQLIDLLGRAGATVELVDEPSLHLERNSSYSVPAQEKNTRAKIKSTVERCISKKTYAVLDSLNNIKGYRYELWCIARAAGTRYCMLHVDTPVNTCREWNQQRGEAGEPSYTPTVFDDLAGRFERPDSRNRWDSPLFTAHPTGDPEEVAAVLQAVVQAVMQQQQQQQRSQQGENTVVAPVAKELRPTMATTNPSLLGTNVLHEIDQATQEVVSAIMEAQDAAAGGAAEVVAFGQGLAPLQLKHQVSLAELRRHKRGFLKLATKVTFARLHDGLQAKRMFIDYLREHLNS